MTEKKTPWNPEHLQIVKQGMDAIAAWRRQNPEAQLELAGADLNGADLNGADLNGADLRGARLKGANLSRTRLEGANLAEASLAGASLEDATLRYANLSDANLKDANLTCTDLSGANLSCASLPAANLKGTDLGSANLAGADLARAILASTYLEDADLDGASLKLTYLESAHLTCASLNGTDLSGASWSAIRLASDLSAATGLDTIHHGSPSLISHDALLRPANGPLPIRFLRGIGLTDTEIDFARAIAETPIQFYPAFISYTAHGADDKFAVKLEAALQARGVRCWFDKKDLHPRDDILEKINQAIRSYDVLLLVCSKQSLTSYWVEDEVERIIEKERQLVKSHGKLDLVMPIDLDGHLFSDECEFKFATNLRARKAANLRGWEEDPAIFEREFEGIVKGLRSDDLARPPAPESHLKPLAPPGQSSS